MQRILYRRHFMNFKLDFLHPNFPDIYQQSLALLIFWQWMGLPSEVFWFTFKSPHMDIFFLWYQVTICLTDSSCTSNSERESYYERVLHWKSGGKKKHLLPVLTFLLIWWWPWASYLNYPRFSNFICEI